MTGDSSPRPLTQIAIAVVQYNDRFLIGQRPEGVALAGLWEFPGGKIHPGETAEDAAVRECLEETGLVVEPLFPYPQHQHAYAHATVQLHFIACRPADAAAIPLAPFRWVPRSELNQHEFPAGNAELLKQLTAQEK
ncbi:(deoxy)nucleoside triphosphate pyrophosphohydrolase [Anatilimnocola sp. NA78]|uniref:(deoxy)nucleoside triphosphate pyrophosphohydrolase n=1 Tax=Anatilimnocola sp. NA78 TaxID=3415683 RepID=UPI003CE58837